MFDFQHMCRPAADMTNYKYWMTQRRKMVANESSWKANSATGSVTFIVSSQQDEQLIHGVRVTSSSSLNPISGWSPLFPTKLVSPNC